MRRDPLAAQIRRDEQAVLFRPEDVARHQKLFQALRQLIDRGDAEPVLAEICRAIPHAYTSLLHLARLQELRGEQRLAVLAYTRALKIARSHGFWWAEASTAPWLRSLVQHGMKTAHDGRIELFHDWLRPKETKHGKAEMRRVADCLAMYLGLEVATPADPRQRPTFLYFPGLPVAPVLPREALPFADEYEAQTETIRDEMRRVVEAGEDVAPFFFFRNGERDDAHHEACPRTSAALASLPLDHVREHGPEVCFSVMRPGAHVLPRRGATNVRSILHLGLDIPDGCALSLTGIEELHWQPGRCFAFDDTYQHEAWNRGDRNQVILLADIWNPYLTAPERDAVADLIGVIGDFNRVTAP